MIHSDDVRLITISWHLIRVTEFLLEACDLNVVHDVHVIYVVVFVLSLSYFYVLVTPYVHVFTGFYSLCYKALKILP